MNNIIEKIDNKINEATLTDVVYKALEKIPEFRKLSMDRQGEISIKVKEMITKG